jgi:hypothetical protein
MHDKESTYDNTDQSNNKPAWPERLESFLRAAEADFYLAISWFETELGGHAQGPEDIRAARADVLAAHAVLRLARSEMARALPASAWTLDTASAERVYGGVSWRALKEEERARCANVDAFHDSAGYKRLAEAYLD